MNQLPALETYTKFDAANYLEGEQDIAAYLKVAAEENDPAFMVTALATAARASNMAELARKAGLTRQGLYRAMAPDRFRRGVAVLPAAIVHGAGVLDDYAAAGGRDAGDAAGTDHVRVSQAVWGCDG